mmetsp:Transcript_47369/g.60841  ORF Transcript_47369/g.60841 Transcript_47369/m.60841 type:complete len:338 (+) Transcript_47369:57-1070(+)
MPFGGSLNKDDPYFFVERKMAPHRLPSIADSAGGVSKIPPPDFWSRPVADFQTLEQAQRAFDHPHLLHSFFNKMDEMLNLLEANVSTSDFSTSLARQMIDHCTATIFCYGESGSGKSTLIRNMTNDLSAKTSHTVPGTEFDTHCIFKSGLRFIDTRGFRVPLVPNSALGLLNAEWLKEYFQWERMLRSVRARMDSQVATDRPLGIMYCHKAGHRVIVERIKQLVMIPHQRMIPVFLVLTDVYSIDDEALSEFRQVFRGLVREIGFNPRGKSIHLLEVNSQPKSVKGREFGPTGMPQLASAILNSLEPMDILTFCHRNFLGLGGGGGGESSSNKRSRS